MNVRAEYSYDATRFISNDGSLLFSTQADTTASEISTFFTRMSIDTITDFIGTVSSDEFIKTINDDGASDTELASERTARAALKDALERGATGSPCHDKDNFNIEQNNSITAAHRRVYVRKGVAHVCVAGTIFGAPNDTRYIKGDSAVTGIVRHDRTLPITVLKSSGETFDEAWTERSKETLQPLIS